MRGTWQTTDSGGCGIGTAAAVILAAIAIAAVAGPIVAAVPELVHIVLITVAVIVGPAVLAGTAVAMYRWRRRATPAPGGRMNPILVTQVHPAARPAQPLPVPRRPAVETFRELHLHFHGIGAEDVPEALWRASCEDG